MTHMADKRGEQRKRFDEEVQVNQNGQVHEDVLAKDENVQLAPEDAKLQSETGPTSITGEDVEPLPQMTSPYIKPLHFVVDESDAEESGKSSELDDVT